MNNKRNYACRITTDLVYKGYDTVVMENEVFRLTMLPGKGSDVIELLHKPTDTDFCWMTQLGLRKREALFTAFQQQYEGGWQEILPHLSGKHQFQGISMEAYGEVSLTEWSYSILKDTPEEITVCFTNRLRTMPLVIEKMVTLVTGAPGFQIYERVTNESIARIFADWGHHITFGTPFLTPGTSIELPVNRPPFIVPEFGSPGGFESLKVDHGAYRLMRPDGIGAQISWDAEKWPHLWFWRDFGGDTSPPYYGRHFNVGLEMFTSPPASGLQESIDRGTAMKWEAHETVSAHLQFTVLHEDLARIDK
ncbi:hypothetical protein Back11_55570 [Paenibacillus baekrokdamisoli]|uniref:Uncharacterized protein n=2 Tax=Paenibacillus baekrokdamisoli TaxID=1712516 RepID=A0A3G9J0Z3_9BACL|nr:hypothetical protein [Paenibacillus baekrokdamisoli]MBB3071805.1 hypothetical protein [Paenibacillus baekrokdamisoli]BBH24212.1 hypothetical protein Back11_55570 [Paenibacillus baekrokdamisoli]